jgi:hypothetical protein
MSFVFNILSNVVANAVFWAALGVAFWSAGRAGQTRFSRFFGVDQSGLIVIVLSNVWKREAWNLTRGFHAIYIHSIVGEQHLREPFECAGSAIIGNSCPESPSTTPVGDS